MTDSIIYFISPAVSSQELNALFAASWPEHTACDFEPVLAHSLLYVCAYHDGRLVGFVNAAWDGGIHAFILDTTVHPIYRRRGIGRQLIREALPVLQSRGIKWLHVDYEPHLHDFYAGCGFRPTDAGLISLRAAPGPQPLQVEDPL